MIHKSFQINGLSADDYLRQNGDDKIAHFISLWSNGESDFEFNTSGSTGKPKKILLKRHVLEKSAHNTAEFLGLEQNTEALLCLPVDFIGGKMMLVRAMVLGWNIWVCDPSPSQISLVGTNIDFVAMTPFQAARIIELNASFFERVKMVILGGGPVGARLKADTLKLNTSFYSTYGMTETASHVALKLISEADEDYKAVPGISFSIDDQNRLVIHAEELGYQDLLTNDVVELSSPTSFKWIGRFDHVINSGGIKIYPEEIERIVSEQVHVPHFVAGIQHDELGEEVCLFCEGEKRSLDHLDLSKLDKYKRPRKIIWLNQFRYTATGKINRSETIKLNT